MKWSLPLSFLAIVACQRPPLDAPVDAPPPPPPLASVVTAAASAPTTTSPAAAAPADAKLMPDDAVGPLVVKLSETPGNFPSENYVSNETSLLHVARTLRDPKQHDRGYVGVGPEQSYTYLALLEPKVSYIVDIRRDNLLEHLMFRGCFEAGATRAEFLRALLARRPTGDVTAADGFAAFAAAPPEPDLQAAGVARTKAVFDRLALPHSANDDQAIARIHAAFARAGLQIAYTMLNNGRTYPTLGENLAALDPDGHPASFLGTDESYARVRRLVLENRVIPVVGDFGGTHALRAVAEDLRTRQAVLGVFYLSNVEQYLFDQRRYPEFLRSVAAMPRDEETRLVRVWFDQGKRHPQQQPGHRTAQIVTPANAFFARAEEKPFRTFWDVVTAP